MLGATAGSGAGAPVTSCPADAVSRLPSAPSSLSRAARDEAETPSTATPAPMPIAIPSADRAARQDRERRDPAAVRRASPARSRDRGTVPRRPATAGDTAGVTALLTAPFTARLTTPLGRSGR